MPFDLINTLNIMKPKQTMIKLAVFFLSAFCYYLKLIVSHYLK